MSSFRIGYGEDIHPLKEGRDLFLCGVKIPFDKGLDGISDGDAPLHALGDALLGALALGDIGKYFPPKDPSCLGMESKRIIEKCLFFLKEKGYRVGNVDVSIYAEQPHLAPFIFQMRENLASLLEVEVDRVSIKAGTNEGFDAVGQGAAIKASAIALIVRD